MNDVDATAIFCPNGCRPRPLTAEELGGWKDGTICDRCGAMWVTPSEPISYTMMTVSLDLSESPYDACTHSTMAKVPRREGPNS
jgi:hypothetical protein